MDQSHSYEFRTTGGPTKVGRTAVHSANNIIRFPRRLTEQYLAVEIAAIWIEAAFPARSENAICMLAMGPLLCSEQTVRRILRKDTQRVDMALAMRAAMYCQCRGLDPLEIAGLKQIYLQGDR